MLRQFRLAAPDTLCPVMVRRIEEMTIYPGGRTWIKLEDDLKDWLKSWRP